MRRPQLFSLSAVLVVSVMTGAVWAAPTTPTHAPPPRAVAPAKTTAPRARAAAPKTASAPVVAHDPKAPPIGVPASIDARMRGRLMTMNRSGEIVPGSELVVGRIQKHPKENLWAYSYVNRDGMIWRTDFVRVRRGKAVFYNATGLTEQTGLVNEMMAGPRDGLATVVSDDAFIDHGAWPLAATEPR